MRVLMLTNVVRSAASSTGAWGRFARQTASVINSLAAALNSLLLLGPLWLITLYIYSILGVLLFSGNDADRFADFGTAMISLFQLSTFDDFGKALFINLYGCTSPNSSGDSTMSVADLNLGGYEPFRDSTCKPRHQFWYALCFFWTYSVVTSMVLLSAFLGIVQIEMDIQVCLCLLLRFEFLQCVWRKFISSTSNALAQTWAQTWAQTHTSSTHQAH